MTLLSSDLVFLGYCGVIGSSVYLMTLFKCKRASPVAQMVKNLPAVLETEFDPWVWKILWRREWLPTLVFLPGEFHEQRSLAGYRKVLLTQLCLTLCIPMDHNPPESSVLGNLQVRILELGLLHCRQILYHLSHQGIVTQRGFKYSF